MKSSMSVIVLTVVLFSVNVQLVQGWTNAEFEMFDLVEELNSANFYEFLGVSPDATVREIKSAYRQLSVKLHPDKNPDDPDAAIKFRQLVGIYEALKDEELRKSYHQVLEFGLPNWRQPMFYFRRARKLAIWQVCIILLGIVTVGQYLAAWGSYFEKKLSLEEMVQTKLRKMQRTKKSQREGPTIEEVTAEIEQQYLTKPSWWNTAPIQLLRLGKYMIVSFPFDLVAYISEVQRQQKEQKERELELLKQEAEEEELNSQPVEPKKPRKRKTFQIPEKVGGGEEEDDINGEQRVTSAAPQHSNFVSGGLWTDDDITMLIKLCTKYPGGFPDRWNHISNIMERPVNEVTHMAKRVLEDLIKKQAEEEEQSSPVKVKVKTKASKVDEDLAEKVMQWTKDEQKRLEMALQMYPKGGAGDRWGKIASHVGKSKEECMQRFKYVAELVKKKKEKVETDELQPTESQPAENPNDQKPDSSLSSAVKDSAAPATAEERIEKQNVVRQSSSSSNNSGSEQDWCMVEGSTGT